MTDVDSQSAWNWNRFRQHAFSKNTKIAYTRIRKQWELYQLGRHSVGLPQLSWSQLRQFNIHQIEDIWIDYTIWRYSQYPYESSSIKAELSAINEMFHENKVFKGIRELMPELKRSFASIDRLNKKLGKPSYRRRPIVDIINYEMINRLEDKDDKLLFALAQQAMLRSDEYCDTLSDNDFLRLKDLEFLPSVEHPKCVNITVRSRKNSKKNEPFNIVLKCQCGQTHLNHKHCVVHMLQTRYNNFSYDLNIPVICSKIKTEPCTNYYANKKLSAMCQTLGMDPLHYGTHSWRIGKATQMIWEGSSISTLMRIGGWATVAAAKLYLRTTNIDLLKFIQATPEDYIKSLKTKKKKKLSKG